MRWLLLAILLTALAPQILSQDATDSPSSPYVFDRVVVLCVGVEQYRFVSATPFAEADAQAVGNSLKTQYGYTPDFLLGTNATKANILAKLDDYSQSLGPRDCFVFFFAGHGQVINLPPVEGKPPQYEGFLIPYEAKLSLEDHRDPNRWYRESMSMRRDILDRIERMKVRHGLIILDACASGFMAQRGDSRTNKLRGDDADSYGLRYFLANKSRAVLAATTNNQKAVPNNERGHGVFTAALIDTLKDFAQRREPASISDIFEDVRFAVMSDKDKDGFMVPQMNTRIGDGNGEFVFIPKSVRKSDVDAATRHIDLNRNLDPLIGGGGNLLTTVQGRALERLNRKTTEAQIAEAFEADNYRFGTKAVEQAAIWEANLERFLENASNGDPNAMAALFYCFQKGLGTVPDESSAYRWAKTAYETGSAAGTHVLAECYLLGDGVPKNEDVANELFKKSANQGFVLSRLMSMPDIRDLGFTAIDLRAKTMKTLDEAIQSGNNTARYLKATIHYRDRDSAKALAVLGNDNPPNHSRIKYLLYEILSERTFTSEVIEEIAPDKQRIRLVPIEPDLVKAERWLRESAGMGYAKAQVALACELHACELFSYRLSLKSKTGTKRTAGNIPVTGLTGLVEDFNNMEAEKRGTQTRKNDAYKWARLASEQNAPDAHLLLAHLYEIGEGTEVNQEKARVHCQIAADANLAKAHTQQGNWLLKGSLLPRNVDEAKRKFDLAFKLGDNSAYDLYAIYLEKVMLNGRLLKDLGDEVDRVDGIPMYLRMGLADPLHLHIQAALRGNEASRKAVMQSWGTPALEMLERRYPESMNAYRKLRSANPFVEALEERANTKNRNN